MGMRVSFELDDEDLRHFRLIMRQSRKAAARLSPEDIVALSEQLLQKVGSGKIPQFVRERLARLQVMIDMLVDHEWRLPGTETARVLNALVYFCEPEDLIPDHIPGLGFLDDAIMIELVVRELRHEIEAYEDFCDFRDQRGPKRGVKARSSDMNREQWLKDRRKHLQARMRKRRQSVANKPLRLL